MLLKFRGLKEALSPPPNSLLLGPFFDLCVCVGVQHPPVPPAFSLTFIKPLWTFSSPPPARRNNTSLPAVDQISIIQILRAQLRSVEVAVKEKRHAHGASLKEAGMPFPEEGTQCNLTSRGGGGHFSKAHLH